MKRRSFLGGLAALFAAPAVTQESLIEEATFEIKQHAVEVAFTPWTYVEEPVKLWDSICSHEWSPIRDACERCGISRFTFMISATLHKRSDAIARNVRMNNVLLERIKHAKYIAEASSHDGSGRAQS